MIKMAVTGSKLTLQVVENEKGAFQEKLDAIVKLHASAVLSHVPLCGQGHHGKSHLLNAMLARPHKPITKYNQ